jgi:hypothetical protein
MLMIVYIEAVVNGMKATSFVQVTVRKQADVTYLKFLIEQIWLLMASQKRYSPECLLLAF